MGLLYFRTPPFQSRACVPRKPIMCSLLSTGKDSVPLRSVLNGFLLTLCGQFLSQACVL